MAHTQKWKFDFRPDSFSSSIQLIVEAESRQAAENELGRLYPKAKSFGIPFEYYGSQQADIRI